MFILGPMIKYNRAVSLIDSGNYDEAIELFESIKNYKDSDIQLDNLKKYKNALDALETGDYRKAYDGFSSLKGYRESDEKLKEASYQWAKSLLSTDALTARSLLKMNTDYKDSQEIVDHIFVKAIEFIDEYSRRLYNIKYDENYRIVSMASNDKTNYSISCDSQGRIVKAKQTDEIFDSMWEVYSYTYNNDGSITRTIENQEGI